MTEIVFPTIDVFNATGGLIERRTQRLDTQSTLVDYFDPLTQKLRQQATFKDNFLEGPTLIYDKKERVIRKFTYERGLLQGMAEFYREAYIYAQIPFERGKIHGVATYYDRGGNKRMAGTFVQSILEGKLHFFNPLGFVLKTIIYVQGKKQGIAQSFYPSGKVLKNEPYQDNLLDGNVTQYYENGDVCSWQLYREGKLLEGPRYFNQRSQEVFRR